MIRVHQRPEHIWFACQDRLSGLDYDRTDQVEQPAVALRVGPPPGTHVANGHLGWAGDAGVPYRQQERPPDAKGLWRVAPDKVDRLTIRNHRIVHPTRGAVMQPLHLKGNR